MYFNGFLKSSLIEWPGKICAVVFVGGCNFRCPFCYNRSLVLNQEELPKINSEEILEYLQEYQNWIDGLMISGGEPLQNVKLGAQNDLVDFIKKIKEMRFGLGIETNGSNPEAIEYLLENNLVDYLAMDIKAPLVQEKYNQLAGAEILLDKIKKSIKLIMRKAPDYEFRTTVVPTLLSEDDILAIVQKIKGAKRCYLQQFQLPISPEEHLNDPELGKLVPYPREFFENLQQKVENYFEIFSLRI